MSIPEEAKIDLDKIISEFIQYVNEDSPDLSTDPNVIKVKVLKPDSYDCPCCSRSARANLNKEVTK